MKRTLAGGDASAALLLLLLLLLLRVSKLCHTFRCFVLVTTLSSIKWSLSADEARWRRCYSRGKMCPENLPVLTRNCRENDRRLSCVSCVRLHVQCYTVYQIKFIQMDAFQTTVSTSRFTAFKSAANDIKRDAIVCNFSKLCIRVITKCLTVTIAHIV